MLLTNWSVDIRNRIIAKGHCVNMLGGAMYYAIIQFSSLQQ